MAGVVAGLLLILATSLTACGWTGRAASVGPPRVDVPRDQQDLVGTWLDAQGRELPDGTNASKGVLVIQAGPGSTSCSTENVTVFMELAWPVGRRLDWSKSYGPGDSHRYVRQTAGSLMETDGPSDLDTQLPAAAKDSGLNKSGNKLYSIASRPEAIWIRRGQGQVERWARLGLGAGCA